MSIRAKKDYLEEDSWKNEGFLPFGEAIPDYADNLEGGDENEGIDEDDKYDGFIIIPDDIDEELPFAFGGSSDAVKSER